MNPMIHKLAVSHIVACPSWNAVSSRGQALVQGLLTVDPDVRLRADDCLGHPWLSASSHLRQRSIPHRSGTKSSICDCPADVTGVVSEIHAQVGSVVGGIELQLRDGSLRRYGAGAESLQRTWLLDDDEIIIAAMQDARWAPASSLGAAFVCYTSKCQIIVMQGTTSRPRNRIVAPIGRQIGGLQFSDSSLSGVLLEKG